MTTAWQPQAIGTTLLLDAAVDAAGDIEALVGRAGAALRQRMVSEPAHRIFIGFERQPGWERSWRIVDHLGITLRVAVSVGEEDPRQLVGKIDSSIVAVCGDAESPAAREHFAEVFTGCVRACVARIIAGSSACDDWTAATSTRLAS